MHPILLVVCFSATFLISVSGFCGLGFFCCCDPKIYIHTHIESGLLHGIKVVYMNLIRFVPCSVQGDEGASQCRGGGGIHYWLGWQAIEW